MRALHRTVTLPGKFLSIRWWRMPLRLFKLQPAALPWRADLLRTLVLTGPTDFLTLYQFIGRLEAVQALTLTGVSFLPTRKKYKHVQPLRSMQILIIENDVMSHNDGRKGGPHVHNVVRWFTSVNRLELRGNISGVEDQLRTCVPQTSVASLVLDLAWTSDLVVPLTHILPCLIVADSVTAVTFQNAQPRVLAYAEPLRSTFIKTPYTAK